MADCGKCIGEFKAALFDLDGVVFDTEGQYSKFWGQVFEKYMGDNTLAEKIKGSTLVQIYDRYFAGREADQAAITRSLDEFEAHMDYEYIPGFEAYIRFLRDGGVKTAVVTSSNLTKMRNVYEVRPEFRPCFDTILTSEDFGESKPSPDCYLKAAARLGLQPSECVVYEDSFNGLRSGRAAGMRVVGLATTNPSSAIEPLSDVVIPNYLGLA